MARIIKVETGYKTEFYNLKVYLDIDLDKYQTRLYESVKNRAASPCQGWITAGKHTCKTGFFKGSDPFFEFFIRTKGNSELVLLAKFSYEPLTKETVKLLHSVTVSNSDVLRPQKYFTKITEADRMDARLAKLVNESLPTCTEWMKAEHVNDIMVRRYGLVITIELQHDTWNDSEGCSRTVDSFRSYRRYSLDTSTSSLLFSSDYSDLKIVCGSFIFPAHKLIMCSKSSVLKTIFNHGLPENKTGLLKIEDTDASVVRDFIRFIYTGGIDDIERNATGLHMMAYKYDVQELKTVCEEYILGSIDCNNVLQRYELGNLWKSPQILSKCLEEIKANKDTIWKNLEEFESGVKKYPELMFKLFKS